MIYNQDNIKEFDAEAKLKFKENKKFIEKLRDKKIKNLDKTFHDLHDEVFDKVDCLVCANCCKTASPIFSDIDIDRIAKHLKIRPSDLIQKYLHLDADRDYVLNTAPCTFLGSDNYCSIYDYRPKACREFPHTDRKNMAAILPLVTENTKVCPAVLEIIEKMKASMPTEKPKWEKF
jgi:uncharacterized protein